MSIVAVFGRDVGEEFLPAIGKVFKGLQDRGIFLTCEREFARFLSERLKDPVVFDTLFDMDSIDRHSTALFLTVGGDGTFLHSISYVKDSGIPILGLNTGRLGFLADFPVSGLEAATEYIASGNYSIEERDLLRVKVNGGEIKGAGYVLNEISVQKTDISSLIRVNAWLGETYLTTYWADGLIVATPTGSTAYSLSAGGPILAPGCKNILLTPLCAHNLNMRALAVPSGSVVRLKVESRSGSFLLTMDSATEQISDRCELEISTGDFKIRVAKLPGSNFYDTLREKLGWGEDKRNFK